MKKILIDAKWLHEGPPSGKVVVKSQVEELKKYVNKYDITLLVDKKDPKINSYRNDGFSILKIRNLSLFSNLFLYPVFFFSRKFDAALFQNSCPFYFKGKSVLFVHDIIFKSHPQYFTFLERMIFKLILISFHFSDSVITISENEKNRIVKFGYKLNKDIHVINNGADHLNNNSDDPKKYSGVNDLNYILYVGRINDRKNIKNLIRAMEYVESDVGLIVAGGGDWKNSLTSYDKSKVKFVGYVSESRLKELYSNAKAFVFVSYEEGFGLPPLEAMSYNLPVIVSNVSCFPEVCGDAPLYVNPDEPIDIANKIDLICKDESLRNSMIKKGRDRVSRYTWEKHVNEMLSVLVK